MNYTFLNKSHFLTILKIKVVYMLKYLIGNKMRFYIIPAPLDFCKCQKNEVYNFINITCKAPNTSIAEFANTVDPDETARYEPSHPDLQSLPSSL